MELQEYVFQCVAELPPMVIRSYIAGLQEQIKESKDSLPSESCPVKHVFAPGMYAREMSIPKGILLIGKIHRGSHINVVSKGSIRVLTEQGTKVITAPCSFVSDGGTKRVGIALEDTVWTTFHATNSTDLAEIEKEIIAEDFSDIEIDGAFRHVEDQLCLGSWQEQQQ